jgi:hypothetical protein
MGLVRAGSFGIGGYHGKDVAFCPVVAAETGFDSVLVGGKIVCDPGFENHL